MSSYVKKIVEQIKALRLLRFKMVKKLLRIYMTVLKDVIASKPFVIQRLVRSS
ncbi:hypothetical protein D3C76_1658520 [compost metagenome]